MAVHPQNSETVTIGVEMVSAAWKLRTTITVPAGPTRLIQVLPLANALADAVAGMAEQAVEKQGQKISCKKGCGACCRSMVPISEIEAHRFRELVESLPEARRSQVLARFAEALRRLDQAGLLNKLRSRELWTDPEYKEIEVQYFLQRIACPFLEDESCSIYLDRPASCREFLVTSPAEKCALPTNDEVHIVKLPFRVMSALARFDALTSSAEHIRWVPLVLALEWAAEHADETPPCPGPELARELFQHVADRKMRGSHFVARELVDPTEIKEVVLLPALTGLDGQVTSGILPEKEVDMVRWFPCTLAGCALILGAAGILQGQEPNSKIPATGLADPDLASFDEMMLKFVEENQVPGAALSVAKDGRLVYARGFGHADTQAGPLVDPAMRFRIASISKPITAAMILRLVELGLLKLEDNPFEILKIKLPAGSDPRLKKITIWQLLHHTAGWDRGVSFDPMFRPIRIAEDQNSNPPATPMDIIHYMTKKNLDFGPGQRYAYSNFGYCILGRVIEKVTAQSYGAAVQKHVFDPIGVKQTELGHTLTTANNEVKYYGAKKTGKAVLGPDIGKPVPRPYGTFYLEAMDSHGGWISSAPDLVRFASAFDQPEKCKILKAASIKTMFARPDGLAGHDKDGKAKNVFYGCGWQVRTRGRDERLTTWHTGSLDGTSTLLVRRADGLCWAVLFNMRNNAKGQTLSGLIDPLVHQAADKVERWPNRNLFETAE